MSANTTTAQSLSEVESFLRRPTGWIVAGIVILLIASGAISYKIGDVQIQVAANGDRVFPFIFSMLGLAFVTIGAIAASVAWNARKRSVELLLLAFWAVTGFFAWNHFTDVRRDEYPFVDVKYSFIEAQMRVGLSTQYLNRLKSSRFVVAVTNTRIPNEVEEKLLVAYSEPFFAPQSDVGLSTYRVDCRSLRSEVKIGDQLRVWLIKISERDSVTANHTRISDIDGGGSGILRKFNVDVGIHDVHPNAVAALFDSLDSDQKIIALARLEKYRQ